MECSQCGICCRLFVINLNKEEYFSRRYKTQFEKFGLTKDFEEAELTGANIITRKEDGSCIYQEQGKCSIHDKRPKACKAFFCDSKDPKLSLMIKKIKENKRNN